MKKPLTLFMLTVLRMVAWEKRDCFYAIGPQLNTCKALLDRGLVERVPPQDWTFRITDAGRQVLKEAEEARQP